MILSEGRDKKMIETKEQLIQCLKQDAAASYR